MKRQERWALVVAGLLFLSMGRTAFGKGGMEGAVSFGLHFYSGNPAESLTPSYAVGAAYHSAQLLNRYINWAHRFDIGLLIMGTQLAAQTMSFHGISGSYTSALRLNFASQTVIPYLEFGPALGIFALYSTTALANSSKSQAAMKYGYMIGTGFDKTSGGRGSGGWGINVNFFQFVASPAMFEFPAGAVTAKGVRIDVKFLVGGK